MALHRGRMRWKRKLAEAFGDARFSSPALNGLDAKLAARLPAKGFFIEAGANDGYTQSNTYRLERWEGWRGILVEPIPALAKRCRRERKKSRTLSCALAAPGTTEVTMNFGGLMSTVDCRETSGRTANIEEGLKSQGLGESYQIKVPARTLDEIIEESGCPEIDFLSLDLEGYEAEALKGLDLERFRPHTMLVETRHPKKIWEKLERFYEEPEELTHHDFFFRFGKNKTLSRL